MSAIAPEAPAATATASWYAVKGPNGDLTWRVQSPAAAIGAKTVLIPDGKDGFDSLYWPNTDGYFPWSLEVTFPLGGKQVITTEKEWEHFNRVKRNVANLRCLYPEHEGSAAIWTRPMPWQAAHMREMRFEHGIRVSAEVDDNYLSDKRLNIFLQKAGWEANNRDAHASSLCVGDALILSTDYLRDLYWEGLNDAFPGLKKHLPEFHVCRNFIDEHYLPEVEPPSGPLRVGYMGSDSHIWDVDLIFPALLDAYRQGCEIVFVGISPALLNPKFSRTKRDWSAIPYTHIPWRNEGYRGFALPLDIGLAPLRVDKHTLGKSDIKWLEYALSGAATVAQNCLVYNRTAIHGETALLAGSAEDFRRQTNELIKSSGLRQRLVQSTRQYISEERLLRKNADEWREAVFG